MNLVFNRQLVLGFAIAVVIGFIALFVGAGAEPSIGAAVGISAVAGLLLEGRRKTKLKDAGLPDEMPSPTFGNLVRSAVGALAGGFLVFIVAAVGLSGLVSALPLPQ